jgi:hypothetical protein
MWNPIRDVDPALILNGEGVTRYDGRPDLAMDPLTGGPHVVWAYNNGSDFDIAYSAWEQGAWSETEFLTSSTLNYTDPRVFVAAQAIYVVWWERPAGKLWFSKHPRMGTWSTPEQVTTMQPAFRPSVIHWEGKLLFAAERGEGMNKEILLLTRIGPSNNTSESVAFSGGSEPLDIELHGEQNTQWMDWCHSPTLCAYSIRVNGDWIPFRVHRPLDHLPAVVHQGRCHDSRAGPGALRRFHFAGATGSAVRCGTPWCGPVAAEAWLSTGPGRSCRGRHARRRPAAGPA